MQKEESMPQPDEETREDCVQRRKGKKTGAPAGKPACPCPWPPCGEPPRAELVQNPGFEAAADGGEGFAAWQGDNAAPDDNAPLTGQFAARLGASRPDDALLEQTVKGVLPGCAYAFSFSINAQNLSNGDGEFRANVYWLPSNTPAIDDAVNPIRINQRFSGNNYARLHRLIGPPPPDTTDARIVFVKCSGGSVLIDDVSLGR